MTTTNKNIGIVLGAGLSGIDITAQLYNSAGSVGSPISTGFLEIGGGLYQFSHSFDDDFIGSVVFYNSNTSGYLTMVAINLDENISNIASGVDYLLGANHGTGQWGVANGSYVVTVTVKDYDANGLPGVPVSVYGSGSNNLVGILYTNSSNNKAIFNLDSGNYAFYAYQHGRYSFANPYYTNVSGNMSIDLVGTAIPTPSAPSNNLVRIYGYVADIGLDNEAGVELVVTPSGQVTYEEGVLIVKTPSSALSNAAGYVYVDVASGIPVNIRVPKAQYERWYVTSGTNLVDLAII